MRKTKGFLCLVCMACLLVAALPALAEGPASPIAEAIDAAQAIKTYTEEAVDQAAIDAILAAGAKAPSAMNRQPWRFTVITDAETIAQFTRSGNGVAIVISGEDTDAQGMNVDFDCGLATANMYLTAHALGLGANIYMAPISQIASMRDALGIPDGYAPVALLTFGHADADAISGASPRSALEDIVNYAP